MNDDLISRKMVLEILEKVFCEYRMSWSIDGKNNGFASAVPQAIKEAPTSYDVDLVISKINSCFDAKKEVYTDIDSDEEFWKSIAYQNAIDIVRNGGR